MIKSWDNFMTQGLDLILESPTARATVKYNKKKEVALLKVTDDKKRVIFKCHAIDQLEQFIKITSKLMLNVDPNEVVEEVPVHKKETQPKKKGKGKK
ncbi:hypothetical protein pb186bvf_003687 [Paramecium bursaria]